MMVTFLTLILLGLSLSMDTLAVSVTIGICKANIRLRHAVKAALIFTFFQTLMPGLGYLAGSLLGRRLGAAFQRNACFAGGMVLILIGLKIVVEHVLIA
jgi:manganese efflux pump family protein